MRSHLVPLLSTLCLVACGADSGEQGPDQGTAGTAIGGQGGAALGGSGGLAGSGWAGEAGGGAGGSSGGSSGAASGGSSGNAGSKGGTGGAGATGTGGTGGGTPPVCDCFVSVAWCGTGAAKKASQLGCKIPLLPEHKGDILYCPNGKWSVKQTCAQGCVEAPSGTPDYCKSATGDQNPVPGYKITTPFGKPGSWAAGYHTGDDYAAPIGTKVVATRTGVVKARSWSYWGSAYGLHVVIETNGVRHLYAHLSAASVSVGQTVTKGQKVGEVGSTGNSTGPHCHYEERISPYGYSNHRNPQFNK